MINIVGIQRNNRVGDLRGNYTMFVGEVDKYADVEVPTIIVSNEMSATGYPLQDLVRVPAFADEAYEMVVQVAKLTKGNVSMLVGFPLRKGKRFYNAMAFCADGKVQHIFKKTELPNNSVFDEVRTYHKGKPTVFTWRDLTFGVPICEDVWHGKVAKAMKKMGAQILLSPNASPYDYGKWERRKAVLQKRVKKTGLPLLYMNRWGAQDELVFDGQSALMLPDGSEHRAVMYDDAEITFSFDGSAVSNVRVNNPYVPMVRAEECWKHHVLGLKGYVGAFGGKAIIGLSGGADSALVLALAVDALGGENVIAIGMPYSPYSSTGSVNDARALAEALGVTFWVKRIDKIIEADREILGEGDGAFEPKGLTEENLQARARGRMLMTFSNQGYGMVLTTGNKSEMCVGYSTLYGDMNGGFNPIKDLYKMEVFALLKWKAKQYLKAGNKAAHDALMRIVKKPPSAELRAEQKDSDSLPVYSILDKILVEIIEKMKVPKDIRIKGVSLEVITHVYWLVRKAQFKRRQSPPGTRWHNGDLDKDYRQPLDNLYEPGKAK